MIYVPVPVPVIGVAIGWSVISVVGLSAALSWCDYPRQQSIDRAPQPDDGSTHVPTLTPHGIEVKPIVTYSTLVNELCIGYPAFVWPLDHPGDRVTNTTMVRTSPVVWIGENGVFETAHSVYQPEHP